VSRNGRRLWGARTGGKSRQRASASHCGHFAAEGLAEFERCLIMSRTQAGIQ
jgi:hypothetical protein